MKHSIPIARPKPKPKPSGGPGRHRPNDLAPAPLFPLRGHPYIQTKLEVGAVNDPLEREADTIADRVLRMPSRPAGATGSAPQPPTVTSSPVAPRRACDSCEAEDEDLRRTVELPVLRTCSACEAEDDELRRSSDGQLEQASHLTQPLLRREPAAGARGGQTSRPFTTRVHNLQREGGRPLNAAARGFLEPRFGVSLDSVRTHADGRAGALAKSIGARAFTLGQHVFFAPGQLRPQSQSGMRLLAHEVTHTLQQTPGLVRRSCPTAGDGTSESLEDTPAGEVRATSSEGSLRLYVQVRADDEPTCVLAYRGLARYYGVSVAEIDRAMDAAYAGPDDDQPIFQRPANVKAGGEAGFVIEQDVLARLEGQGLRPRIAAVDLMPGNPGARAQANAVATKIHELPPAAKEFLFTGKRRLVIDLSNYEALGEIADLVMELAPEEREEFMLRAHGKADSWARFRAVLEAFAGQQRERGEALLELVELRRRLSKLSAASVEAIIQDRFRHAGTAAAGEAVTANLSVHEDGFTNVAEVIALVERLVDVLEIQAAQIGLSQLARYRQGLEAVESRYEKPAERASLHRQVQAAYHDPAAAERFRQTPAGAPRTGPRPPEVNQGPARQEQARKKKEFLLAETREAVAEDHPLVAERGFDLDSIVGQTTGEEDVAEHLRDFFARRHAEVDRLQTALADPVKRRVVFEMDELRAMTFTSLSLASTDPARRLAEEYIAEEAFWNTVESAALLVGEIALAILASAIGGPFVAAVAVATGVKGLVYDLPIEWEKYQLGTAAHHTYLSTEAPSVTWAVLTAVGAGLDIASGAKSVLTLLKAFDTGALRGVDELSDALKAEGIDGPTLDQLVDAAETRQAARVSRSLDEAAETAATRPVEIRGEIHETFAWPNPQTGRYVLSLCSDDCGMLARKIELNLRRLADDDESRAILEKYERLAQEADAKPLTKAEAEAKAEEYAEQLTAELEARGLGDRFDPNIREDAAGAARPVEGDEIIHTPVRRPGELAAAGGRGRTFPNQVPGQLQQELDAAASVGAKPIKAGSPGFDALVNEGRIKWVITENGELVVGPHTRNGVEISHAVLSGGKPVHAAGQADIATAGGQRVGIDISPHSGHFLDGMPQSVSDHVVELGREAFARIGVKF